MSKNRAQKSKERELKKKLAKRVEHEVGLVKKEVETKTALIETEEEKTKKIKERIRMTKDIKEKYVLSYVADKNGCGYFRSIWPCELLSTYKNINTINTCLYQTEVTSLTMFDVIRFQRQATNDQLKLWKYYLNIRQQYGMKFKMQYELDDLLMEIEPQNKIAYDFFNEEKKQNHLYMLRTADKVVFSTNQLKDIYVKKYGILENKIEVVPNYLPQFIYSLPYKNSAKVFDLAKNKPRVFWSGSSSHLGKGGDLEFLIPLVTRTTHKYDWIFQGVIPEELIPLAKEGKISFISWVPIYGLANVQFYKARPDICLAPLKPSIFNSCKSDLKYLEACALGAPCICSSFDEIGIKGPYDDANAEICIENDIDVWENMIDHLVATPEYFKQVVDAQYTFINSRWMENNLDKWHKAILE
jgi:hypothetical protein